MTVSDDDTEAGAISLVVGDRRPLVRRGIERAFEGILEVRIIGTASATDDLISLITESHPTVATVGHCVPDLDAFAVLSGVNAAHAATKVLVLTDDWSACARAFAESGAACSLPQATTSNRLKAAVLACGLLGVNLSWQSLAPLEDGDSTTRTSAGLLSIRERDVIQLLAEDKSPNTIAGELFVSTATIRTHLSGIYRKLGVSGAPGAVAEGFRRGLLG
jgi:two-component system nitrate/nitrite response regulator NarL